MTIIGVVVLISAGILFYFNQKQSVKVQPNILSSGNFYKNTSLGLEINLSEGQIVCSDSSSGKIRLGKGESCSQQLTDAVIITNISGYQEKLPVRGDRIYSREKSESFLDWVKRFSQNDRALVGISDNKSVENVPEVASGQVGVISPNAIIEKKPDRESAIRQDTLFIEVQNPGQNPNKPSLMLIKESGDPNLTEIASQVRTIPITTGDISIKVSRDGANDVYPYYKGKIFNEDKTTVALTYMTDANGFFSASLAPGTYLIEYPKGFTLPAYNYLGDASRIAAYITVD